MDTVASREPYLAVFTVRGLPARVAISRTAFFALLLLVVFAGTICLVRAVSLVDRPFAGFLVNERMFLAYIGPSHWSGVQAGLKFPDKVLGANGRPVASIRDLDDFLGAITPGDSVRYTVERSGRILDISVPAMRFTWLDLILTFGIPFLVGILYVMLGATVFILKPDTPTSWVFVASCALLSISNAISFDFISTHSGYTPIYLLMSPYLAAAVFHLSLIFPRPLALIVRKPLLVALPYVISTTLAMPLTWLYPDPMFLTLYQVVQVYFVVGAVAILASAAQAYFRDRSVLARARARVILWGAVLGLPLTASVPVLSSLGITLANLPTTLSAIPLLIFPASIGYAIARHNLFDVDVYIKRAVGYGIMTAVVALTYFTVQTVISTVVLRPVFGAHAESVYPIVFALLVVFFFNPVNRRVQDGVEQLFFRKPYDYRETVASVGDALTSLLNLDAILTKVIYTIKTRLFLDTVGVVLLDPSKGQCRRFFLSELRMDVPATTGDTGVLCDDPLFTLLSREKKLLTVYDIAEDPQYDAVRESCGRSFSELGASVTIPLLYQDTFTGVLAVGRKKSGHFYSRDDIDLLKTLSTMTATAVEQSREKNQRQILMQLFSKHVAPQVADALWRQRDQFLDGGRPRSQKLIATVLFTDLQGFSGVSEQLDPQALMDWLNTYMEAITKTVMDHGGVVDDYFGDGVKVNFGVPIPRTVEAELREDAINAATCALALENEMVRVNETMRERGLPTLRMRVGVCTGPVLAGSLGSAERMKYTTLGDTVNTAARLESFSKEVDLGHLADSPCRILIAESTLRLLDNRFETLPVGELELKGKQEKVPAHCLLSSKIMPTTAI